MSNSATPAPLFGPVAAVVLPTSIALSLLFAFCMLVFPADQAKANHLPGTNSFSYGATGHRMLYELLRASGRPVARLRQDRLPPFHQGLVLVLEPQIDQYDGEQLHYLLGAADCLLVLPKRTGEPERAFPHWLRTSSLRPPHAVDAVLQAVLPQARIERSFGSARSDWIHRGSLPAMPDPAIEDVQLMQGQGFRPLLQCAAGTLLAEFRHGLRQHYLLSDPDLLANHGLPTADNAEFILTLLDAGRGSGNLLIDETLHGYRLQADVWQQLGKFPLAWLLVHAGVVLLLLSWHAVTRFGPVTALATPQPGGKTILLERTAELLSQASAPRKSLQRYIIACMRMVGRRLGWPPLLDATLRQRLLDLAQRSGKTGFATALATLEAKNKASGSDPHHLALTRAFHRECVEMAADSRNKAMHSTPHDIP